MSFSWSFFPVVVWTRFFSPYGFPGFWDSITKRCKGVPFLFIGGFDSSALCRSRRERSRTIYPDAHVASTWFLNILLYVDKCEESRVTMRTVPNAIIIDDTQPRTPNQSFISLRLRRAVRPPVLSDRTKRDGRSSSWRKSFSPCLCRPVLRLTEGPE